MKKPTILVASHPALVQPFAGLRCDGKQQHSQAWGHGLSVLQQWPWNLAARIVEGSCLMKKTHAHISLAETASSSAWDSSDRPAPSRLSVGSPGEPTDLEYPIVGASSCPDEAGPNSSDEEPTAYSPSWKRCPRLQDEGSALSARAHSLRGCVQVPI